MKRRQFLAASALLSLFLPTAAAGRNKKSSDSAAKPNSKPSGKTSSRGSSKPEPTSSSRSRSRSTSRVRERPTAATPLAPTPAAATAPSPPTVTEARNALSLPDEPLPNWRSYDITATLSLSNVKGKTRVWLPLAQYRDIPWQRSLGHSWRGNFDSAGVYRDPVAELEVFYADWNDGAASPQLQVISQVAKQERHFDITRRGGIAERNEVLRRCLQASNLVPTDGLVRQTAERVIGRIKDPLAQGKAIYDWVVENTVFDPSVPGIGRGDVEAMLDSGKLGGRSADISLLFVALCRSIGIPARPVFGLRVDSSRLFSGLGAVGNLHAAQHCRAEFYTPGYGWIPVDPSDVRKSIHDERLMNGDAKLVVLRKLLFGFWELNWIAYNAALDVRLNGSNGRVLPFLVFPQAEAAGARFDSTDGGRLIYSVTASRVDG